jgi:hypothetical protein
MVNLCGAHFQKALAVFVFFSYAYRSHLGSID